LALTPLDIHNKVFARGFRGYDEDDVNNFLDQIIKDYELTIREKNALEDQVKEMEERLNRFSEMELTLNKSIAIAQETADNVKENARKESHLIIKEAEKNADRIIDEALSESRNVALETEELRRQAKVFRTRLKMLIESQLDMVNNEDWDDFFDMDDVLKPESSIANQNSNE